MLVTFFYKRNINHIHIDNSIETLISGDSHTQSGIDDSILKSSLNISQSSEHFLYTYNVLKLLLKNENKLEKVILGVSFHSFSSSYDDYIKKYEKTKYMFPKYFQILDNESIQDINEIPLRQSNAIFKNMIKDLNNGSKIHKYSFIGEFYKSEKTNLNDTVIEATLNRHYFTEFPKTQDFSYFQLKYLNKIEQLCNKQGVELILINTPITKQYHQKIPKKFINNYYSIINNLRDKVVFYDFADIKYSDAYYGDGDHLNSFGAEKFSQLLNQKIYINKN